MLRQADGDNLIECKLQGVVLDAFRQAFANAGTVDEIDCGLFENAGTDNQNIVLRLPFKNDIVNAGQIKKAPQQQPGRPCPDNDNLFTHSLPLDENLRGPTPPTCRVGK